MLLIEIYVSKYFAIVQRNWSTLEIVQALESVARTTVSLPTYFHSAFDSALLFVRFKWRGFVCVLCIRRTAPLFQRYTSSDCPYEGTVKFRKADHPHSSI